MKQNKFTIIVPTRERADTLYWCLKTLVAQDYENLEILVSDNFSQDNTKEVVDSFNDKRIRYINTGKRVDMSSNWEFALSHVNDGKVMFLGDDDGVLIGALKRINQLFYELNCENLAWDVAHYSWPNITEGNANYLTIPLNTNIIKLDAAQTLTKVCQMELQYFSLLGFYGRGFVDMRIIKEIKQKQNNIFFTSSIPDVYACVMITRHVKSYYYSSYPFAIGGGSKKSNTGSAVSHSNLEEANTFMSEIKTPVFHSNLEMLSGLISLAIADGILYGISDGNGKVISEKLKDDILKHTLRHAVSENSYRNPIVYEKNVQRLLIIAQKNNLETYVRELLGKYPNQYIHDNVLLKPNYSGLSADKNTLRLDGNSLKIDNVYDASVVISEIIGLNNTMTKLNICEANLAYKFISKLQRAINYFSRKYLWKYY